MIGGLGENEADALRRVFADRISPFSDLVCWWFEKARSQLTAGRANRVGLVATNSIRGGRNRLVLDRICHNTPIFEAWSDEGWTVDGAAVRVSLICFGLGREDARLGGQAVVGINSDLTTGFNLTTARRLTENSNVSFVGSQKSGPFDVDGSIARDWLVAPLNVNHRPNSDSS